MACPEYVVVGNGYWASVMHGILAQRSKVASVQETRRQAQENDQEYQARMEASLAKTRAHAAWLCVPPSLNTLTLVAAAVNNGMHVVAEKPWIWKTPACRELASQAQARGVVIGVHHEYCMLDAVQSWRSQQQYGEGLKFQGRFTTSRPDKHGLPAKENLGSHLFAIWAFAVPKAEITTIRCGYGQVDQRVVSTVDADGRVATIDFTENKEQIIQRYIAQFEGAFAGDPFPFNLDFGLRVLEAMNGYQRSTGTDLQSLL
jgi:predicted dehydrogenase